MRDNSNYEPFFDYSNRLPDQTIEGFDRNSMEDVKSLINEVLLDVVKSENDINKAGLILESMLEEDLHGKDNREEIKVFLKEYYQKRVITFDKINNGLAKRKKK